MADTKNKKKKPTEENAEVLMTNELAEETAEAVAAADPAFRQYDVKACDTVCRRRAGVFSCRSTEISETERSDLYQQNAFRCDASEGAGNG